MATKHVPIRTCIATGEKKPKNELMRFVLLKDGKVVVDPKDQINGRGANLSMTEAAFEMAIKKKAFERAFKMKHPLSAVEVEALKVTFQEAVSQRNFRKGKQPVTIKVSQEDLQKLVSSIDIESDTDSVSAEKKAAD